MRCETCDLGIDISFTCPYCKGVFCTIHRLPEAHNCPMLYAVKVRPTHSTVLIPRLKSSVQVSTSKVEVAHLLIAWFVLTLCFSMRYVFRALPTLPLIFIIYLGMVGTGFVFHELMHKFTAQRYGYWSEFRLWPQGLLIALFSSLVTGGSFIFAAPGATYVIPHYDSYEWSNILKKRSMGAISLAGPLSNVAWATIFFALSGLDGLLGFIGIAGFQVNLWLAAFNMIPLGSLDGKKVLSWNVTVWVVFTIPLWIIQAFVMLV